MLLRQCGEPRTEVGRRHEVEEGIAEPQQRLGVKRSHAHAQRLVERPELMRQQAEDEIALPFHQPLLPPFHQPLLHAFLAGKLLKARDECLHPRLLSFYLSHCSTRHLLQPWRKPQEMVKQPDERPQLLWSVAQAEKRTEACQFTLHPLLRTPPCLLGIAMDQPLAVQSHAIAVLRIGDRVVPPEALEARAAWLRVARLHPTKEGVKGVVRPHADVLQHLAMHELQGGPHQLPDWQQCLSVVPPQRLATLLIRPLALSQHLVIGPAARLKLLR